MNHFFQNTWLLPAAASSAAAAAPPRNLKTASVYQRLGVRTFINAVGTLTTRGGTLMPPEVKAAMEDASTNFVMLHELQEKVGARLAELSGAEDAFVTAGASCSLCLATCAVTAGDDKRKMRQLPDLTGMKSEIVIQTPHRSSFDHAFSMVGVKLVNVDTEPDIPEAINENTAALAFVLSHNSMGHKDEQGREFVEYGSRMRGILEELEKAHIYIEQLHNRNRSLQTQVRNVQQSVAELARKLGN